MTKIETKTEQDVKAITLDFITNISACVDLYLKYRHTSNELYDGIKVLFKDFKNDLFSTDKPLPYIYNMEEKQ